MFNPAIGAAMVAANNARVVAWQAQQRAQEQADKLAALEARVAVERQEHAWALDLVHWGWSPARAADEASRETQRRLIYPGLRQDTRRMAARKPRVRSGREFVSMIAARERAIERRRSGPRLGPHPWLLGLLVAAGIVMAAWLGLQQVAGSFLTTALGAAALVGACAGVVVAQGSRGMWTRFRQSAQARADRRAEVELASLPGYLTWRYDLYMQEARAFWASQGNLGWGRQRLSDLGRSGIDGNLYDDVHGEASALLDEVMRWELKLLLEAIDERLEARDLARAKTLIGELTPESQRRYRSQLQRLEAGKNVKASSLVHLAGHRSEVEQVQPRLSLIEGQATRSPRAGSTSGPGSKAPSRVQDISLQVDGDELSLTWDPPARNAGRSTQDASSVPANGGTLAGTKDDTSTEYVITARCCASNQVECFSVAGTAARFKANTLGRTARFELSIEARSGDRIGPKSKSYFVDLHPPAPEAKTASRPGATRDRARPRAALEAYDPHAHDEKMARARAEIAAMENDPNSGVRPFRI